MSVFSFLEKTFIGRIKVNVPPIKNKDSSLVLRNILSNMRDSSVVFFGCYFFMFRFFELLITSDKEM